MKYKPYTKKDGFFEAIKDICTTDGTGETAIAIDTSGSVVIENFKKLADYQKGVMIIRTKTRMVYIYGENLVLVSCKKGCAYCKGDISRIELSETEV